MARLVKGGAPTTTTTEVETFRDAAERIVHAQRDEDGLVSWKNRLQRLKDYCYEGFGDLPVTQVQAEHVRDALKRGLASGVTARPSRCDQGLSRASSLRDELGCEGLFPARKETGPAHGR
jgi:hypothetical protein